MPQGPGSWPLSSRRSLRAPVALLVPQNREWLALLEQVDVLVDGEFVEAFKDISLHFRGSSNQRVIDVQASLKQQDPSVPILHCPDYAQTPDGQTDIFAKAAWQKGAAGCEG